MNIYNQKLLLLPLLLFTINTSYGQDWVEDANFELQILINNDGLYGYAENIWGREIKDSRVIIPFKFTWAGRFDNNGHAIVEMNYKVGMIDTLGMYVIPVEYDYVYPFTNGYATVYRDGKFGAVNNKGKLTIPLEYDFLSAFTKGGRADAVKGSKWGVIDTSNRIVHPFNYLLAITDDKNYTRIATNDWGYLDPEGKPIFDNTYQSFTYYENGLKIAHKSIGNVELMNERNEVILPIGFTLSSLNEKGTRAIVRAGDKFGLYDPIAKKLLLPAEYESLEFDGDMIAVTKNYSSGPAWFSDLNGNKLFGKEFNRIKPFGNIGFAEVSTNKKWGLIDLNGNLILPIEMGSEDESSINISEHDRISANKKGLWGMTDLKENIILPYEYISPFGGGNANPFYFTGELKIGEIKDYQSGKTGIVDSKGNWVFKPGESIYDDFGVVNQFVEGGGVYVPVSTNGKWGVYDLVSKNEIVKTQFLNFGTAEFAHATFLNSNNKWGLILYNKQTIYSPDQYEYMDFDDETNLLTVEKDGKKGLVDLNKNLIVPVVYDDLSYNSEANLYWALKDGKVGFIDEKGRTVIPFKYDPLPIDSPIPNDWVNGHVRMIQNGISVMLDKNAKKVVSASDFKGPADMHIVNWRFSGTTFCFKGEFDDENETSILLNGKLYEDIGGNLINWGTSDEISFSEGLVAAKRNGLYGYLDRKGEEVIPFEYERASSFLNGVAYVKKAGKLFIINREGQKLNHADMRLLIFYNWK